MKIIGIVVLMMFICNPGYANQSIKYCYNCRVTSQQKVVRPYVNVSPAPVVYPGPVVIRPVSQYYPAYIESAPVIPQGLNCWLQPDPYTFLGEIFGYDYMYVCR